MSLPPDMCFDTAADFYALLDLEDLVNACLARRSLPPVDLNPDYTPAYKQSTGVQPPDEPAVAACVAASRKEQLTPYVAPPVLLYLTNPTGPPTAAISLSGNGWQVAWGGGRGAAGRGRGGGVRGSPDHPAVAGADRSR